MRPWSSPDQKCCGGFTLSARRDYAVERRQGVLHHVAAVACPGGGRETAHGQGFAWPGGWVFRATLAACVPVGEARVKSAAKNPQNHGGWRSSTMLKVIGIDDRLAQIAHEVLSPSGLPASTRRLPRQAPAARQVVICYAGPLLRNPERPYLLLRRKSRKCLWTAWQVISWRGTRGGRIGVGGAGCAARPANGTPCGGLDVLDILCQSAGRRFAQQEKNLFTAVVRAAGQPRVLPGSTVGVFGRGWGGFAGQASGSVAGWRRIQSSVRWPPGRSCCRGGPTWPGTWRRRARWRQDRR